ncbi:MAG: ABC transporter permease [Alphaproteobacteria bacterium]
MKLHTPRLRPQLQRLQRLQLQDKIWKILAIAALTTLATIVLAPLLAHLNPEWIQSGHKINPAQRLQDPSPQLWLGSDALGRNLAARLCIATPNSLILAAAIAILATVPGTILGTLAAANHILSAVFMRLADALLTLPPLVLALAFLTLAGPNTLGLTLAIAIPELPRVMRLVRALTLALLCEPWYQAARGLGLSPLQLLRSQLLPALAAPLAVIFAQVFAIALLVESLLGFLGLGLPAENPGWGSLLAEGRSLLRAAPHLVLAPALAIAVTTFCVQILADAMRQKLQKQDPQYLQDS